jgi:hypothetical protein
MVQPGDELARLFFCPPLSHPGLRQTIKTLLRKLMGILPG